MDDEGGEVTALESRLQQEDVADDVEMGEGEGEGEGYANKVIEDDSVFMRSYIPRTLNEVYDPERDVGALNRGEGEKLIYKDMIGIVAPKENKVRFDDEDEEGSSSEEDEGEDEEGTGEDVGDEEKLERRSRGHRHEDKEAKKVTILIKRLSYTLALTLRIGTQEGSQS